MKRFRKTVRNKLKSQRGETLAEVLIAVLVSSLGLTLLASMIAYSGDIIERSKKYYKAYVDRENALVTESAGDEGEVFFLNGFWLADAASDTGRKDRAFVRYFTNTLADGTVDNIKLIYAYKAD